MPVWVWVVLSGGSEAVIRILLSWVGLLLFIWWSVVLWGGEVFDRNCIEGRVSMEQAEAINQVEWGKCPFYRSPCVAVENDRVLKRQCSEFSRRLFLMGVR
jgi:hypothetical protein